MQFIVVVFPEPFGPSNPKISPVLTDQIEMVECHKLLVAFYKVGYFYRIFGCIPLNCLHNVVFLVASLISGSITDYYMACRKVSVKCHIRIYVWMRHCCVKNDICHSDV